MAQPFPSLVIRADAFVPQGAFAEAQADYLTPDTDTVAELDALLKKKNAGIVAHFYMDPELQGVLSSCSWPHIKISDSLQMADSAIAMAKAGVRTVVVLGVDFMSENVRAMLDAAGFADLPVFRVSADPIGCSLAEAAETREYEAWLRKAATVERSIHVVYINTSLRTKASAHAIVPTITCTSSNVVQTILQAAAQIPDVNVWYGPDTYMGRNIRELFENVLSMGNTAIAALHPKHDSDTIRSLLPRFHHFEQGVCIVHHMFGTDVAERVRRDYADAFVTAHFEVPSAMFDVALDAQKIGRGVVGSTSNILSFIQARVKEAHAGGRSGRLRFVLGTEAGMITSIVRSVRNDLVAAFSERGPGLEVEIIFPVASEAIAATNDPLLPVVPGVAAGEGCDVAGGCATCPYMKMNSLDGLLDLLNRVDAVPGATLAPFHPKLYTERVEGRTMSDLGGEPILHMRHFQKTGTLPDALVQAVTSTRARHDDATR